MAEVHGERSMDSGASRPASGRRASMMMRERGRGERPECTVAMTSVVTNGLRNEMRNGGSARRLKQEA